MRAILLLMLMACVAGPGLAQSGPPPVPVAAGRPVLTTNSPTAAGPAPRLVAPPAQRIPFPRPPEQRVQQAFPAPGARSLPPAHPLPGSRQLPTPATPGEPEALRWDAVVKEQTVKPGELSALMSFAFTNISSSEVVINWVRTSCGCTLAKLPPTPWRIPPGEKGDIAVTMDLRGKVGTLSKIVTVDTSKGPKFLTVTAHIPAGGEVAGMDSRTRNMELAKVDRQIVFKNDCASCHAEPAKGKHGEALYAAACAICHDSPHRATMVPDLRALTVTPTPEYWKAWVSNGKPGTLMPAFAKTQDGILDEEQIQSLVDYLSKNFPAKQTPEKGSAVGTPASAGAAP